jgi:hypothetical protein
MPLILEGIVTTLAADGTVNMAPMGPEVDESLKTFVLKPFRTATTYANVKRAGEAVFHVTDDVELIARAAVGRLDPPPAVAPATAVNGWILSDACRWYALRVRTLDDRHERTRIECDVVDQGRLRDFFGFNRAKHAVLEAAILATRTHLLAADKVLAELDRLRPVVDKTGGAADRRAFDFLVEHLRAQIADQARR